MRSAAQNAPGQQLHGFQVTIKSGRSQIGVGREMLLLVARDKKRINPGSYQSYKSKKTVLHGTVSLLKNLNRLFFICIIFNKSPR